VHPTVFLRGGEELGAVAERTRFRQSAEADGDEGFVVIHPHLPHRSGVGLSQEKAIGILQSIQLLDEQRALIRPLHPLDVMLARIPRKLLIFRGYRCQSTAERTGVDNRRVRVISAAGRIPPETH
jgi:hypothetical protein